MKHAAAHPTRSIGFLSRLHDGELSEAESREFELHASECPECSAAAAEFEAILSLYRQAGAEPADAALAARIARRLDARLRWRPPVRYVRLEIDLLWASVVATCLVGVLALYSFRASRRHPAPVSMVAETNAAPPSAASPRPESTPPAREAGSRGPARAHAPSGSPGGFAPEERSAVAPSAAEAPSGAAGEAPVAPGAPAADRPAVEPAPAPASPAPGLEAAVTTPPVLIRRVEPLIPEANRRVLRAEGPFTAEAVITENGDVASIRISPPAPPALEGPILAALREWKYRPALRGGRAVPARLSVVIYVNRK